MSKLEPVEPQTLPDFTPEMRPKRSFAEWQAAILGGKGAWGPWGDIHGHFSWENDNPLGFGVWSCLIHFQTNPILSFFLEYNLKMSCFLSEEDWNAFRDKLQLLQYPFWLRGSTKECEYTL